MEKAPARHLKKLSSRMHLKYMIIFPIETMLIKMIYLLWEGV